MPPFNVKSDTSQKKILRAFKKLGFEILPPSAGKGSHRLVKDPRSGMEITVQRNIYKAVIFSYCNKLKELGYEAETFAKHL